MNVCLWFARTCERLESEERMNQRLCNHVALMITQHCIELLVNVLDEEQKLQARDGIYEICLAGIEAYECQVDRMQRRLKPLDN